MKTLKTKLIIAIIGNILLALAVGFFSSLLIKNNLDIYSRFNQPALAPPSQVFPIVWTILYILMGISAGLIFATAQPGRARALLLYFFQLLLNIIWCLVFFNLQAFWPAFGIIVILWFTIIALILSFRKVNQKAALLQIPYLLWVTFATYLNLMLALLN